MNIFDNEERIINFLQDQSEEEILFYPKVLKYSKKIKSIINQKGWKNWINSSGKQELPPDFYNTNNKIMMDVMRVDDHAFINKKGRVVNYHNQRESQLRKEIISKVPNLKEISDQGRLIINPVVRDIPIDLDHNYIFYVNNFRRVVGKHIEKIENYKKNHIGYQLVLLVFDESSPYIEKTNEYDVASKPGQIIRGNPHIWWLDKNMIYILKNSNADYVIWFTPYKYIKSIGQVRLPKVVIYNTKKIPYKKLITYNVNKMDSLEK